MVKPIANKKESSVYNPDIQEDRIDIKMIQMRKKRAPLIKLKDKIYKEDVRYE